MIGAVGAGEQLSLQQLNTVFTSTVTSRDDNGSAGHGSWVKINGSPILDGSCGLRVSVREPLTHDIAIICS